MRSRLLRCTLSWSFSLLLTALPLAGEIPRPTPAALKIVEGLRATRMGVDRFGNLWSWNQNTGAVQAISAAGSLVAASRVEEANAVDFDPEWGWVWIDRRGRRLVVDPAPGDRPAVTLPLEERMADVAWIGEGKVAVSAVRAAYRVEIWDVASRQRIATWGQERPIPPRPGTVRLNRFLLKYNFERQLLYTLETFSGRIEVFDREGRSVMNRQVAGRDRQSLQSWLRDTDSRNRAKGETEEVTLSQWPAFVVDPEGDIWLHEKCVSEDGGGSLARVRVTLDGQLHRSMLGLGSSECCSVTSTLWSDRLILYSSPSSPQGACVDVVRIATERNGER